MKTGFSPFQRFFKVGAIGGILILIFTVVTLVFVNSSFSDKYYDFLESLISITIGNFHLSDSIIHWINNGLMTIFFFVAGLEIKREVMIGELSSYKKASFPVYAAVGGMVVPALFYIFLNKEPANNAGWTIPTATDILICFGILSLLGKRVPVFLKVFIFAFALINNLGAVLITTIIYHSEIQLKFLLIGSGLMLYLILFNFLKIRIIQVYIIFGVVIWYMFLQSGIHPVLTGILIAFAIPKERKIRTSVFRKRMESNLLEFALDERKSKVVLTDNQLTAIDNMVAETGRVKSPLQSLEHKLHGFVTYIVLPLFVLANAGVMLNASDISVSLHPLTKSIGLSLVFGKITGIFLFSWLAVKLRLTVLPVNIKWIHILGIGILGGVGFSMSLFLSGLSFANHEILEPIKMGIYLGSFISAIIGFFVLRLTLKKQKNN